MAWPTSNDVFKTAVNNTVLTLAAVFLAGETTCQTTGVGSAPAAGSFHIGTEVVFYTGKTATNFTGCTRGQDGTTDVDHVMVAGGNEIIFGPEAHMVNQYGTAVNNMQTAIGITGAFNFVAKAGNETVAGIKTFSSSPIVPTPTTDMQAATKKYGDDTFATIATAATAANLAIQSLTVNTITSHATPTPIRGSKRNLFTVTAQGEAAAFAAPSGSPAEGDTLVIRIKDDSTVRALTWNAIYRAIGTTIPTTTVDDKTVYVFFIYNNTDSKWDCLAVGQEA